MYDVLITRPLLDFIERRIQGPQEAQNIFVRRGTPDISVWSSLSVARTPKIQNILKMLRLSGFNKPQAEHSILCCLKRTIAAACPDTSARIKAVRISDIRLVARPGQNQHDKMFQTPEHIPWEDGMIEVCLDSRDAAQNLLQCRLPLTIILGMIMAWCFYFRFMKAVLARKKLIWVEVLDQKNSDFYISRYNAK